MCIRDRFNDLREKQKLAYSVSSHLNHIYKTQTLALTIGTTTENKETGEISYDNLQKSIEGFKKHINKLKCEKVSEEELKSAKLALKNGILESNEGGINKTANLNYSVGNPYGLTHQNKLLDEIDKITPEDIYNAANYIFNEKPVYSIVATENTLNANKKYLDSLVA